MYNKKDTEYVNLLGSWDKIEKYAEARYEAGRKDAIRQIKTMIKKHVNYDNVDILIDVLNIIDICTGGSQ
jgi:hypothetical protein